jgi:hypothetical protein
VVWEGGERKLAPYPIRPGMAGMQQTQEQFAVAQRAEQGWGSQPLRSVCFLKLLLVIGATAK